MKTFITICLLISYTTVLAQRPATKTEQDEDARVLRTLSEAMPHEMEGWLDEGETSYGSSDMKGRTGFHNNTNFSTRDIYEHQYTISYRLVTPTESQKKKIEDARSRNDFAYIMSASTCEINILVNGKDDNYRCNTALNKLSKSISASIYRDAANSEYTVLYFGKNWTLAPNAEISDDGRGIVKKEYFIKTTLKNSIGTTVQSIQVMIKANSEVADLFMKQINWDKINGLLGTGTFKDDISESTLKKYYPEKSVAPVKGMNTLSFTMVAADGTSKTIVISSSKNDFSNSACLRNHNENPQVMQDAHIDFHITDDKNPNLLFMMSLPIIRTTGKITATFDSDYDYQVMWRGNTDVNHSFSPVNIEITLSKWAPVGDFLEGSFSGTATLSDHNDFSTEKPVYTILNGKFRLRRIKDELH